MPPRPKAKDTPTPDAAFQEELAASAQATPPDDGHEGKLAQALMTGLHEPFDPATEPPPIVPQVPGVQNGGGDAEREQLRERVRMLERALDDQVEIPPYDQQNAATGHLEDRLARVTGAMSRIPKRGYNESQKYPFVAHGDVLDAVRPALAAEGIAFVSKLAQHSQTEEGRTTQTGSPWSMWQVDMQFTFSCWVGDTREHIDVPWRGWAEDYGDKGGAKALSAAIKTFLIQQFLISTGDDPDVPPADASSRPRAQASGNVASDVRQARNAALDWNQKLPKGTLSKIAKKVAGNGVIIKIEDVAQLQKIAKAAERYAANPEGGEAWLTGDAEQPNGDAARQEQSGEPEAVAQRDLSQPLAADGSDLPHEPVTLPGPEDAYWDPPLDEDERRQLDLGVNPRPPVEPGETEL